MTPQHTERTIGLFGSVLTLIGFLIGASIYILPGQLAAIAGPGVILAYLICGGMAFFACLLAAQIGCVISRNGGSFHAISNLISPMVGFVSLWLMLAGVCVATALIAKGFANYWLVYFPSWNSTAVAIGIVLLFCIINMVGTRISVVSQSLMTLLFLAAMAVFSIAGIADMDKSNLVPFLPTGFDSVLSIMVPAYFSWIGFTILIEIGGEIKDPGKNILRSLMIGFVVVLVFYTAVCVALVGTLHWETLKNTTAPISEAAELLLPSWLANFITVSALLASATTINGILLAYSRDIYAMAKQRLFPVGLANLTENHAVPARAILTITTIVVMLILTGGTIIGYASIAVTAFLLIQIALAVVAIRIPSHMPKEYRASSFRLSLPLIWFSAGVVILSSLGFLLKALADGPEKGLMLMLILVLGWLYYNFRIRYLAHTTMQTSAE